MGFPVKHSHELPPGSEADAASLFLKTKLQGLSEGASQRFCPPHPTFQPYRVSDRQALPWVQHACNIGTHRPVRKGPALLVVPYKKAPSSRPAARSRTSGQFPALSPPSQIPAQGRHFLCWAPRFSLTHSSRSANGRRLELSIHVRGRQSRPCLGLSWVW